MRGTTRFVARMVGQVPAPALVAGQPYQLVLPERGVRPSVLVGVLVDRSLDMLVALLGVLKAGGAYVPLDPAFPAERLAFMLEDSQAAVLLTQTALAGRIETADAQVFTLDAHAELLAQQPEIAPTPLAKPDDLAYVIFTSGSTGRPKGVQIPHRAVVNFMTSMAQVPGLGANDVLAAVTTLSFDIATLELFLPLTVGARVVVVEREIVGDGGALAETLEEEGATVMQATPVTWLLLLAAKWQSPPGFKALCGGEALPQPLAERLVAQGLELWNMYGPTETTIWSTVHRVVSAAALKRLHTETIARFFVAPTDHVLGANPTELLGFPLGQSMLTEIAQIDLRQLRAPRGRPVMVIDNGESPSLADVASTWTKPTNLAYRHIPSFAAWADDVDKGLVPHSVIEAITTWLTERFV